MPTSNLAMWPAILRIVYKTSPRSILDVGPGHGKAGLLLREYVGSPPIERIDAVEVWEPYVTPRLRALYDEVLVDDVLGLTEQKLASYDLVLMIDVIEHLDKAEALALLKRIPGWIVVCTPMVFFQNPEYVQIPPEAHRSLWSLEDFRDRIEADLSQLGGLLVALHPLTGRRS